MTPPPAGIGLNTSKAEFHVIGNLLDLNHLLKHKFNLLLYKLYNTKEYEHNVCIFSLPPLLTVLQGPWSTIRSTFISFLAIVNTGKFKNHYPLKRNIQIYIYFII